MNPFGFVDPECLWEILIYQERNPRVLTLILIPFHLFAMCRYKVFGCGSCRTITLEWVCKE